MMDQFMGPPHGRRLSLLGKPSWTLTSLAYFVGKTNAAVFPVYNYRDKKTGKIIVEFYPSIQFEDRGEHQANLEHNSQKYNDVLEGFIRKHPEQWLWIHKRWKRELNYETK